MKYGMLLTLYTYKTDIGKYMKKPITMIVYAASMYRPILSIIVPSIVDHLEYNAS